MPLARLENFLKNLNGNTLYVDPNELDSTDSIENRGNSRLRPFKTIQRALLEAARFSYVAGSNNDLFDQTTIVISPGTHYIDNRPGYYVDSLDVVRNANNETKTILEFNILSNFDITDPDNELYVYNSVDGGVILPKGTSLVATDLRKTKIRPLFVPDPEDNNISKSAIFRLTGSCYFFGFTIYDGDPLGKVYKNYNSQVSVTPSYSHHKLTAFEYADGINKVFKNNSNTNHTDLEIYYYKVAKAFGQQSSRNIIDGYLNLQPNIDEYRIVGELGSGFINIDNVISGDGEIGTNIITVTTETEHNLSPLTPILISGVGEDVQEGGSVEYNGNFVVSQVLSPTEFTYLLNDVPESTLNPSTSGSTVKVVSDTTTSSSPYVFNCSLKSAYGMNGLHADGSKATGFRSMVTAQFTGISLQKDDRAFVKYSPNTGTYLEQSNFGVKEFLHQQIDSIYKPEWSSFHIKSSNDAFIQCVSIFAIGYANQFVAESGGDQSITNSNSNFGQRSLLSDGFRSTSFPKDDFGYLTHIIPPKDVSLDEQKINIHQVDDNLPNSSTKIYIKGYNDILTPPDSKFRGYAIGGKLNDKIYYNYFGQEYYANINPNYQIKTNISNIDLADQQTPRNFITLESISGISTGLSVKVISKNAILPDGIDNGKIYFIRPFGENNALLYETLENCINDVNFIGSGSVNIKNTLGLSSNNLSVVSKISDISSGSVGSPIQWDSSVNNWYISISIDEESPNFVDNLIGSTSLYLKRVIDTRSEDDKIYRVRYVIPKDSENASVPSNKFILQKSGYPLNSSYPTGSSNSLNSVSGDQLFSVRNKNVIIDAWYSDGTATIVTKNPHRLNVNDKVSIYNLKSSSEPNPIGIGSGTGYNGSFEVSSVVDDLTFRFTISRNPGIILSGSSDVVSWLNERNCTQVSRTPPYTIYDENRESLPYFTQDKINNEYQIYSVNEIQKYVKGSTDGIYYLTLDLYKNKPSVSPFNSDSYKLGQFLDTIYPKQDFDNLNVDPDPSTTIASRKLIGSIEINDQELSSTKEIIVNYLNDFDFGNKVTNFTKNGNQVTLTTEKSHNLGGIKRLLLQTPKTGFLSGTYYDIPLCGGSGKNATIKLTIVNGSIDTESFEITNPGSGYLVNDVLTIKGIPGSVEVPEVVVSTINSDPNEFNIIQIVGAKNSGNNGNFAISSFTSNTITYTNPSGSTETSSNASVILSGIGYAINSLTYNLSSETTTVETLAISPHSFAVGNKVVFDSDISNIFTVVSVSSPRVFEVDGNVPASNRVSGIGLIPTLRDANTINENLSSRHFLSFGSHRSRLSSEISPSTSTIVITNFDGLRKGDFIQIENEIMLITEIVNLENFSVRRGLFGTQAVSHPLNSSIKTVNIVPIELRRPSILRASGHTFEYTGFGPGNYSTAMPSNQTKVLSKTEVEISQSLSTRGGLVVYSGMNSNGEFFIGKKKWDASTGKEIIDFDAARSTSSSSDLDLLTVNKLIVNSEIDSSTAVQKLKNLIVSDLATFESDIDVSGNVTVGAGSSFIGSGTIPIGGIIMWYGSSTTSPVTIGGITYPGIPSGWSLCDGSTVNNLKTPDLRERFIVGAGGNNLLVNGTTGYNPNDFGGENSVSLTVDQIPSHDHPVPLDNEVVLSAGVSQVIVADIQGSGNPTDPITLDSYANNRSGNTGGGQSHENRPPYYALAFIMRVS